MDRVPWVQRPAVVNSSVSGTSAVVERPDGHFYGRGKDHPNRLAKVESHYYLYARLK